MNLEQMPHVSMNGWLYATDAADTLYRAPVDNPSEVSPVGPDADPERVANIRMSLENPDGPR